MNTNNEPNDIAYYNNTIINTIYDNLNTCDELLHTQTKPDPTLFPLLKELLIETETIIDLANTFNIITKESHQQWCDRINHITNAITPQYQEHDHVQLANTEPLPVIAAGTDTIVVHNHHTNTNYIWTTTNNYNIKLYSRYGHRLGDQHGDGTITALNPTTATLTYNTTNTTVDIHYHHLNSNGYSIHYTPTATHIKLNQQPYCTYTCPNHADIATEHFKKLTAPTIPSYIPHPTRPDLQYPVKITDSHGYPIDTSTLTQAEINTIIKQAKTQLQQHIKITDDHGNPIALTDLPHHITNHIKNNTTSCPDDTYNLITHHGPHGPIQWTYNALTQSYTTVITTNQPYPPYPQSPYHTIKTINQPCCRTSEPDHTGIIIATATPTGNKNRALVLWDRTKQYSTVFITELNYDTDL